MKKTAYVLPEKLSDQVERIQHQLGMSDTGSVISKAIELLNVSIGRKIVLEDMHDKTTLEIDEFCKYDKNLEIKKDGSN